MIGSALLEWIAKNSILPFCLFEGFALHPLPRTHHPPHTALSPVFLFPQTPSHPMTTPPYHTPTPTLPPSPPPPPITPKRQAKGDVLDQASSWFQLFSMSGSPAPTELDPSSPAPSERESSPESTRTEPARSVYDNVSSAAPAAPAAAAAPAAPLIEISSDDDDDDDVKTAVPEPDPSVKDLPLSVLPYKNWTNMKERVRMCIEAGFLDSMVHQMTFNLCPPGHDWQSHLDFIVNSGLGIRGVTHFKFGITYWPSKRYVKPDYINLRLMCVALCSENSTHTAEAEETAITRYRKDKRCVNVSPGGESAHHACSPHYLYVVFGGLRSSRNASASAATAIPTDGVCGTVGSKRYLI